MKAKRAIVAGAALLATSLGVAQGTAFADVHNSSDTKGHTGRCASSHVCLYYHSGESGAKFSVAYDDNNAQVTAAIPDLAGHYFDSSGAGAGQSVKNNAASAEIYGSHCSLWVYYNSNYGGNVDYFGDSSYGQLWYTYNEDASLKAGCP
ncbi:peptidase inhibitor family I36 protein [Streptomyces sp. NBC_00078]|uniref:peptidase inhibitor family I36 protein n=1 Tax=unclassified Streptomyces TaxID=2593676 RepID=UPI00225A2163|nr:peptidase inhibitor family I36 protein [Streptomyces sp. NBC_00078]MCX5421176.1 peptidase inhibitor family I36 protein [Streptomyces sp. NBC_00078]